MSKWLVAVLGLSLISVACGDDAEQKDPIVIPDNNGENNTDPNNTDPNNTDPNNVDPNNTEPNNVEPNNTMPMNEVADIIGDGDAASVDFVKIHTSTANVTLEATALAFNPIKPEELWITQRQPKSDAPCTSLSATAEGCGSLEGVTTIIFNPGEANQTAQILVDGNSWHFMRRPSSMAFGAGATFATCHEERTGNYLDDPANFIGPTLWSSDLSVYAQDPGVDSEGAPLNGSHLDMLHSTPFCMGIAHETANVYWTFNGFVGAVERYDFKGDHGPGYHDHSDGEIQRFAVGEFARVEGVPSHMDFVDGELYIADTGNSRIAKLNPDSATVMGSITPAYEPLAINQVLDGASITDILPAGTLERPSGLVHHEGVLFVSDNASGKIVALSLEGEVLRELQTELTDGQLSPLTIGPDGKLYFADLTNADVWRIDPK